MRVAWWWLTGAPLDLAVLLEHVVTGAILCAGLVGLAWPRRPRWSRWGAYGALAWLWSATVAEAGLCAPAWIASLGGASASLLVGDLLDRRRPPIEVHATGALGVGAVAHLTHYAFALDYAGAGGAVSLAAALSSVVLVAGVTVALASSVQSAAGPRRTCVARALGPLAAAVVFGLAAVALTGEPPPLSRARPAVRWEELAAHARAVSWLPSLAFAVLAAVLPGARLTR